MSTRQITCECGHVVVGNTEEGLLAAAHEHVSSQHPELVGRLPSADLLAMAVTEERREG